jgi:hypothetical protein
MSRRKNGYARPVQNEGFDPERLQCSTSRPVLRSGLKNGTPVIPRSSRVVEPNHHSLIFRAIAENAVTTLPPAGNVCAWVRSRRYDLPKLGLPYII